MNKYIEHDLVMLTINNNDSYIKGDLILRHLWKNDPKLECNSLWQYKETFIYNDGTKVFRTLNSSFEDYFTSFKPQHLYITSNDEPKEGDWCYDKTFKTIVKINFIKDRGDTILIAGVNTINTNDNYTDLLSNFKKIISTTDKSLNSRKWVGVIEGEDTYEEILLPQIHEQFIEYFITEYNKCNVITKVLVEYIQDLTTLRTLDNRLQYWDYKIVINSDNTINIKLIEVKTYTSKEVEQLCRDAWQVGYNVGCYDEASPSGRTSNDWIRHNLKS